MMIVYERLQSHTARPGGGCVHINGGNMIRRILATAALGSALTVGIPTSVYAADRGGHHSEQRRDDRDRRQHFDRDDEHHQRYVVPYSSYGYWDTGPPGYYYYLGQTYYDPYQPYYYPNPTVYPNGYGFYGGFWVR